MPFLQALDNISDTLSTGAGNAIFGEGNGQLDELADVGRFLVNMPGAFLGGITDIIPEGAKAITGKDGEGNELDAIDRVMSGLAAAAGIASFIPATGAARLANNLRWSDEAIDAVNRAALGMKKTKVSGDKGSRIDQNTVNNAAHNISGYLNEDVGMKKISPEQASRSILNRESRFDGPLIRGTPQANIDNPTQVWWSESPAVAQFFANEKGLPPAILKIPERSPVANAGNWGGRNGLVPGDMGFTDEFVTGRPFIPTDSTEVALRRRMPFTEAHPYLASAYSNITGTPKHLIDASTDYSTLNRLFGRVPLKKERIPLVEGILGGVQRG